MSTTEDRLRQFGKDLRAFTEGFTEAERRRGFEPWERPRLDRSQGMRFLTETFRVHALPEIPLTQVPPQPGFITAAPHTANVALLDDRRQIVGRLFPVSLKGAPNGEHTSVCRVTESYAPEVAIEAAEGGSFPKGRLESFMCEVSYGVNIQGFESTAVCRGPRLVQLSDPFVDQKDGLRTIDLEIVEMYLAGYDLKGMLVVVTGGKHLGLPPIMGQIKALTQESDFPATLYFDLIVEVAAFGRMGSRHLALEQ